MLQQRQPLGMITQGQLGDGVKFAKPRVEALHGGGAARGGVEGGCFGRGLRVFGGDQRVSKARPASMSGRAQPRLARDGA